MTRGVGFSNMLVPQGLCHNGEVGDYSAQHNWWNKMETSSHFLCMLLLSASSEKLGSGRFL